MSVASGMPTFRGEGGLWTSDPELERECSSSELLPNVPRIWELFEPLVQTVRDARPNAGHLALARLPRATVVTQNVDGLHQLAGSPNVIELHGSLRRQRCSGCGFREEIYGLEPCEVCGAPMRPDIVLFGEAIEEELLHRAFHAIRRCEVFLAVGTSSMVVPASLLVDFAREAGARTVLVNLEPDSAYDEFVQGRAEEVLPGLFL